MSQRVFLHVGLPKSGTTYIQAVLGKNKRLLKERDRLLYPGATWGEQVNAVRDLRRMKMPPYQRAAVLGSWDRIVAEMASWTGDSVFSMEWLCMATPGQVQRVAKDLGFAEVHVVFTARDIARTVPAAWQEFSQNRSTWRWPEFLAQVAGDAPMDTPAGSAFWNQQDLQLLLDRWSSVVPAERVHVVTLPQSGADPAELWRRMAQVLGIEPVGYDLTDLGANASLGLESAELMRQVNLRLADHRLPMHAYNKVFKQKVAKQILARRKGQESKVLLPAEYHDWARTRAEQQIDAVKRSGAQVLGDLEELRPVLPTGSGTSTAEPSPEAVLDAAVDALVTLALELPRGRKRRAAPATPTPAPPRESLLRRTRFDVLDRVRGRSAKDLAAAAGRRLRGSHRSEN